MNQKNQDSSLLRAAIREVIGAARKEATAFQAAADDCTDASMDTLRASHLDELNAVQALLSALELYEKRLRLPTSD